MSYSRKQYLKAKGVTNEQYEQVLAAQDGKCKVCFEITEGSLNMDIYESAIKGLLCTNCLLGVRWLRKNLSHLKDALDYLK